MWLRGADATAVVAEQAMSRPAAPPPLAMPPPPQQNTSPGVMIGTTSSDVYIQVDFALRPK